MRARVCLLVVWWWGWWCACSHAAPEVILMNVHRCCGKGEALDPTALHASTLPRDAAAAACQPIPEPSAAAWQPLVFAPALKRYRNSSEVHFNWNYTSVPLCEVLKVVHHHAASYSLMGHDRSLYVRYGVGGASSLVPQGQYCVDSSAALYCKRDAHAQRPSSLNAVKCCAKASYYNGSKCVPDEPGEERRAAAATAELGALANGSVVFGWPVCAVGEQYGVAGTLRGATLRPDGSLAMASGGSAARLDAGAWCAEAMRGERGVVVMTCAAIARATGPAPAAAARHAVYGAGLAVGAAFLAATLAASFALPAAHHALHWRCQTHYVAALMLGDILLAATQLAGDSVPPTLCRAIAVCMHFLFLSAFFWLNTMCFNIWWTFRDFRPTSLERGQETWRLRVYMVYAWGGPLALAGVAALLDALPASAAASFLRPRFAESRCWFYGDTEILVYFFGPVGVLLLVNLALFVSTTRQLTCGLWRRDEVKATSERAALGRVCAKLVVVMGVTWGADVVSWAAGGPDYVWYATDLLNALQGVLIFLVVGCQRHAWAALKRAATAAACCWRGGRGHGGDSGHHAARGTHSSTHLPSCGESLTNTTPAPPLPPTPAPLVAHTLPAKIPMETVC